MADRNAESHFGQVETTNVKRSIFPLNFRNIGTCNTGTLVPFLAYADILPGDTFKTTTSAVVRMQTPLNPTMDDLFVDTYYFAIPHRLVWDHWKQFFGEVSDSAWYTSTEYEVPMITAPASTGVTKGTIADYMGIPKGVTGITYQALPFRAYCLVYDTWFRNQNLIAPSGFHTDDTDRNGSNTTTELGGLPFKAGKIPDYFTTCLPETQKPLPGFTNGPMTIPLGTTASIIGTAPVVTGNPAFPTAIVSQRTTDSKMIYGNVGMQNGGGLLGTFAGPEAQGGENTNLLTNFQNANAYVDLTTATAATINALRLSFQIQKLFEARGRNGSRFFECIKGEFGVSPNLGYLQYPEYLGGKRTPLDITQITQTSSTVNNGQALGETGGMSHTAWTNEDFTKSFQENTILLGIMVIRQYHFYDQGLHRMWSRRKKLDYYTPVLAHLGEMPVYKKEIWATGTSTDSDVFGYQERWGEYKYGHETATGEMNTAYAQSLDIWHYGDKYASVPTLAQNWFEETPSYVDRTIAVTSATADQFKFDIATNIIATRPMPVYCTPGLIDHF